LAGLVPALGSGRLVAAAADAIGTGASKYQVEPWYGVDLALALSALSIGLGAVVFWRRLEVRQLVARVDWGYRIGPEKAYVLLELGMLSFVKRFTAITQHGKLRLYLLIVVSTLAALVWLVLLYAGGLPTLELEWDLYPWEAIIAVLIVGGAAVAVTTRSRLGAVTALGTVGYGIALVYVLFSAPDLAIAQILVETLTVLLFVLAFYHMPKFGIEAERRSRLRDGAVAIAAGALMTLFVLAAAGTVTEPVSTYFSENSFPLAKGQNVVNTIIVDFRSLDTLAEVAVLAIAGFGVYALLKLRLRQRSTDDEGEA
jgi:multicomponent Na+:H+ antiporter subunit A